jgi:hypothetical protein
MATNRYLLRAGLKAVVVVAEDATDAKAVAKAAMVNDTDADWDAAVVTDVAAAAAGADMEGWRLNVKVDTPSDVELYNITVTAGAADTVDDMGDDAVTALEAAGGVALTPSYATPLLTIAAIADGIGDHKVYVTMMPPLTWPDPAHAVPGFVGLIVDEGFAGAVLTCALVPAQTIPVVVDSILAPALVNVRDGVNYGTGGNLSIGSCHVPAAGDVEFGVDVDATTGTLVLPLAADVEVAIGFGAGGTEVTGTMTSPDPLNVRDGVKYGGDGTEFEGICVIPAAADVEFGVDVDATTGTFVVPAAVDVQDSVTFGAAAEFTGTFEAPATTDVRDGVGYGAAGTEFEGECIVPAASDVESGVGVDATTGTFIAPATADVRDGVTYGDSAEFEGVCSLPVVTDVRDGVQYGEDGTEFEGTCELPDVNDVRYLVQFGAVGVEFTGNMTLPLIADVQETIMYGTSGTEFTGVLILPTAADVQSGVGFGSAGTEFTGSFIVPAVSAVHVDVTYGNAAEFTGTLTHPVITDVRDGVQYGAGGTELEGTLALPAVVDVEEGVQFGAAGTEFEGTFVVPAEANVELDVKYGAAEEFIGSSTPGEHCFLVQLDENAKTEKGKVNTLVVAADTEAQALEAAQAYQAGDSDYAWADAVVTQATVATSMEDWTLNIVVVDLTTDPDDHEVEYDVTVTAGTAEKLADLGTAMAAALVVEGLTANYNAGTSTLTVAAGGDNIGNRQILVALRPPDSDVSMDSFIDTVTDEGAAGDALTVVLKTSQYIPSVRGAFEEH